MASESCTRVRLYAQWRIRLSRSGGVAPITPSLARACPAWLAPAAYAVFARWKASPLFIATS